MKTTPNTIIVGKHESGYVNGYFLVVNQTGGGGEDNKALFYAGGLAAEGPVSQTSVNDGGWHQVVGVYKSGVNKAIYVDGVAEATSSGPAITANTVAFVIGGLNYSGVLVSGFTGLIDDVQVYNHALSSSDILYLFQNPGMVLRVPPFIAVQPTDQTVGVGGTAAFTVVAGGEPPLSYQWQHETTNLAGASGASLVLSNVQPADAGTYAVRVTNAVGSVISSNALLTVSTVANCVAAPPGLVSWWRAEGNALDGADGNFGALAGNTSFGAGKAGQAFSFDGNGDGVLLGKPGSLELQDFTIEAWIKRASASLVSSAAGVDAVFICYGTGGYGFGLDRSGGHPFLSKIGIDLVTPTANVVIVDTSFHHLAVTKSGTSVVFYVDGVAYPAPSYSSIFTFSTGVGLGARGDKAPQAPAPPRPALRLRRDQSWERWQGRVRAASTRSEPRCPAGGRIAREPVAVRRRESGSVPGLEATHHVGRAQQPELLQGSGREARRVALRAQHDHPHVVAGGLGKPCRAGGVEPPLEHVALDQQGSGHLALEGALRGRADVDELGAVEPGDVGRHRAQPVERAASPVQEALDVGAAHQEAPALSSDTWRSWSAIRS